MSSIERPNFYIFTGGPGAGKTTLLDSLIEKGYACVPEVARTIIQEQCARQGNALHTGDRLAYYHLMLERSILDFMHTPAETMHFFDRGIPDLHSYQSQYFDNIDASLIKTTQQYRYHTNVFLFPPWSEIYCHDAERKLSFSEAVQTYYSVKSSYEICGYKTIDVPKTSVKERVHFILEQIERAR